jgi:hypothetical protein
MKKELEKIYSAVSQCAEIFDNAEMLTASTVIQNMLARLDEREEFYKPYLEALRLLCEMSPCNHVLRWAYDNTDMTLQAHFYEINQ